MQKNFSALVILPIVIAAAALGAGAYYLATQDDGPSVAGCTAEAKLCPDGSAVGRTGPDCRFAPCPSPDPTPTGCSGPSDRCQDGYTCIQRCGPPVAREDDLPPGYYCELDEIAQQPRNCPICLAADARIATPDGEVLAKDMKVGTRVWSVDAHGARIMSTVMVIGSTPAPRSHRMTQLVLDDGREVRVSPNHPAADGRLIGSLRAGDAFDGAIVRTAELVPYADAATYDILPDSMTGAYWANGILLGSTLLPSR